METGRGASVTAPTRVKAGPLSVRKVPLSQAGGAVRRLCLDRGDHGGGNVASRGDRGHAGHLSVRVV